MAPTIPTGHHRVAERVGDERVGKLPFMVLGSVVEDFSESAWSSFKPFGIRVSCIRPEWRALLMVAREHGTRVPIVNSHAMAIVLSSKVQRRETHMIA